MVQLSGNDAPPPTNAAGSSSPNSCAEIAELLSRLQFTPTQLQDLFDALADIATGLNKHTHPTSDNEAYDLINADDVPQDVSSEGTGDEATEATSHSPTTAAPSTVAAESVIASPFAASKGESDTTSVPEAPVVSVAPTVDAPVGTTVMAASPAVAASPATAAPVSIAAPAAASTTRVFNGVSYQYPANGSPGPFYLVTRGRDIGVFVGWENTSPLVTRVSASVSFRVPSAEEGRVRMESSIAAGFARRL